VIFEDARADGAWVELPAATAGVHVRRAGEDFAPGDEVVAAGARLGWGELAAIAAAAEPRVVVARRPEVAIVSTGDELVGLGREPAPHQVIDSSAHALAAMVVEAGGVPRYLGIVRDRPDEVRDLVARALAHDVVLTTGGVSAGDHDHVRAALAAAGVTLDFWKVAMKPGKPLAVGTVGGTVVFALPGNPVSSLVAFELFVRPALLAMQGAAAVERPRAPVVVVGDHPKAPGRAHFLRARLRRAGERLIATPLPKQGSHVLSSLVAVDALVEVVAESVGVTDGDVAPAVLLRAV
jgi:molybdopterin molybdotransferase